MAFNEEFNTKKKLGQANQRNQASAGSQSTTSGNTNVYKGIKDYTNEGSGRQANYNYIHQPIDQAGPPAPIEYPAPQPSPTLYQPRDYLGRPVSNMQQANAGTVPSPIPQPTPAPYPSFTTTVGNPANPVQGFPDIVKGSPMPGSYTSQRVGQDINGPLYRTTPLNQEDVNRVGKAVYSRPQDIGVQNIPNQVIPQSQVSQQPASQTALSLGMGTGTTNAPQSPAENLAERFATGDVFSTGAVGETYRRLSQQRNDLELDKMRGKISPGRYNEGIASIAKEEQGYRNMLQNLKETSSATLGGTQSAAQLKAITDQLKHNTLSADKRAQLEFERDKFLADKTLEYEKIKLGQLYGVKDEQELRLALIKAYPNQADKAEEMTQRIMSGVKDRATADIQRAYATNERLGELEKSVPDYMK